MQPHRPVLLLSPFNDGEMETQEVKYLVGTELVSGSDRGLAVVSCDDATPKVPSGSKFLSFYF